MCLVALLGLIVPRVTLVLLWLLGWTVVLRPWWLGVLGFFLAPFTTVAYVLIHHWSGSVETSAPHLVILGLALMMDVGSWSGTRGRRETRSSRG